jgi:hypothetical protein
MDDFKGDWESNEGDLTNRISFFSEKDHWIIHSFLWDQGDTLFSEYYRITGDSADAFIEFPNGMHVDFEKRSSREIQFQSEEEIFILKLLPSETLSITLNNSRHEPYTLNYRRIE